MRASAEALGKGRALSLGQGILRGHPIFHIRKINPVCVTFWLAEPPQPSLTSPAPPPSAQTSAMLSVYCSWLLFDHVFHGRACPTQRVGTNLGNQISLLLQSKNYISVAPTSNVKVLDAAGVEVMVAPAVEQQGGVVVGDASLCPGLHCCCFEF